MMKEKQEKQINWFKVSNDKKQKKLGEFDEEEDE
jgi:hypothetical protein